MICRKCGSTIEENRFICSKCGTPVQIVSEYGKVDEELQKSMEQLRTGSMEEKEGYELVFDKKELSGTRDLKIPSNAYKKERTAGQRLEEENDFMRRSRGTDRSKMTGNEEKIFAEDSWDEEDDADEGEEWEEFHLEKQTTVKQKRVKLIASIVALSFAIIALIVGIVIYAVISVGNSSYKKQMENGEDSWKAGKYEDAIAFFETAIDKADSTKQKLDTMSKLAALYVEYGDINSAIFYFESAAEQGKLSNEDVSTLITLYEEKADIDAIRKLAEVYCNSETESFFEKHLLNQPVFSYKSGTYSELLTVEITAADNEQIFYTLDNTEASPQSTPYTGPLQIGEGTTVVRAVAQNQNGLLSDEIITTYEIKLNTAPMPVISPDSGSYAEALKVSIQNIPTNCTAYYTIDGTDPTKESIEYTEPFDMLLGNYVIKAVCINNYTEQVSPVAMKIYDLSINGKVSWAAAPGCVMNRLQELGEVLDGNGTMSDGSVCTLLVTATRKVNKREYYIVKRYHSTSAGLKEQGSAYAVDISTGAVFRAEDNGCGEYNLSGM